MIGKTPTMKQWSTNEGSGATVMVAGIDGSNAKAAEGSFSAWACSKCSESRTE